MAFCFEKLKILNQEPIEEWKGEDHKNVNFEMCLEKYVSTFKSDEIPKALVYLSLANQRDWVELISNLFMTQNNFSYFENSQGCIDLVTQKGLTLSKILPEGEEQAIYAKVCNEVSRNSDNLNIPISMTFKSGNYEQSSQMMIIQQIKMIEANSMQRYTDLSQDFKTKNYLGRTQEEQKKNQE